jgi:hypothetical protein
MSITRFPDGDVKVSGCHRPKPSAVPKPPVKTWEIERQFKAAKRAASMVRDIVKWYQLSYLWTLTYRGPEPDRSKVQKNFDRFCRLVREKLPSFNCLAVYEYHLGGKANHGGIHLHLACGEFYPVEVLRAAWWRIVGDGQGNVQIKHRGFKDSFKRVGNYLAKYIAKQFDSSPRAFGQHRYLRSRVLTVPREKLVFFKGHFREHRYEAMVRCVFESLRGSSIQEWISDDGWQFVYKSYS